MAKQEGLNLQLKLCLPKKGKTAISVLDTRSYNVKIKAFNTDNPEYEVNLEKLLLYLWI